MEDARRVLLAGLIDDAGLFPPARLPMEHAVAGHIAVREGHLSWIQHRFLCPASRLDELAAAIPASDPPWPVALILDQPWDGTAPDRVMVEAVEGRDVALLEQTPAPLRYVEGADPASLPDGWRAKVRCGGAEAAAFPSSADLATFVDTCAAAGVPFKATAGLHHPLPRRDDVTGARMHGFLNLAMAAGIAATSQGDAPVLAAVLDDDAGPSLDGQALRWKDYTLDAAALARTRMLFVGFGSCSFAEPTDELAAMGIL